MFVSEKKKHLINIKLPFKKKNTIFFTQKNMTMIMWEFKMPNKLPLKATMAS